MKIRITSRHQKLSASLRDYIEEKLERLEKYYDRIIDCEVIMDSHKTHELIDVNMKVSGSVLHVTVKDTDVTKAIDKTIDKLEVQLKKFKAKMKRRPHVRVAQTLAMDES